MRGRPSRVRAYRYPAAPDPLGVAVRLPGPEQVFRFVLRRPMANAGAVVLSQAAGTRVSPRLVRDGSEDLLAGYAGLPLRLNPYQSRYFGLEPVVGVFRPTAAAYDLVFDTTSRLVAGAFTFRFWVNDTAPPTVRLLSHSIRRDRPLRLRVTDRGSGVDPSSLAALVDGGYRRVRYLPSRRTVEVLGAFARGRHRLVLTVADYQETKNNENAAGTLPNTRRLRATFAVR